MLRRVSGMLVAMGTVLVVTGMSVLVMMLISGSAFGLGQKLGVAALTLAGAGLLSIVGRQSFAGRRRISV